MVFDDALRASLRKVAVVALVLAGSAGLVRAASLSVAQLDSAARSAGNRKDIADRAGMAIFTKIWPAQVLQVSANQLGSHTVLGLRISGVKFHTPLTRTAFIAEVVDLVGRAFRAVPSAEEVDLWASEPISVGHGVIVSGDLAKPTSRQVFTLTVRRAESPAALTARIAAGAGVFWDEDWARTAFKQGT